MRKILLILILLTIGYILPTNFVSAQTDDERIADLRIQIEKLEKQASQYRSGIATEKAKAQTLNNEISGLKNQIKSLETKIILTSKKIEKTTIEIGGVKNNIFDTQEKITTQKNTIGRLMMFLDRSDQENLVAVLLKYNSLSDFLRQEQSAENVNAELLDLVSDLKKEKGHLEEYEDVLDGKKQELEILNQQNNSEKKSLGTIKSTKDTLLAKTKGQEAEYQKMLAEIERKKSLFFTEIKELETRIIQGGEYIVHISAKNLPAKGIKIFSWPEQERRITQGYGCTSYARCGRASGPYGGAPHNGIDMASGVGDPITSIGDGEIVANGRNDGWGNWVAIRHPPYDLVSIYGHMSALSFLRVGTYVKMGDVIGYEGSTGNTTGSHLHLSIYKDFFTYVNTKKDQLYFNYFEGTINPLDYL